MKRHLYRIGVFLGLLLLLAACGDDMQLGTDATPVSPDDAAQQLGPAEVQVESQLLERFNAKQQSGYLIYFQQKPDLSKAATMSWKKRGRYVVDQLRKTADASQARVRKALAADGVAYKAFWVDNVISVNSSSYATFNKLLAFNEIEIIRAPRTMGLILPEKTGPAAKSGVATVENNITHINTDDVWNLGYRGEDMVVANIDTGVLYTHETLLPHYRGNNGNGSYSHDYNWWDPNSAAYTSPHDYHSHGSHTMGTMVGEDAGQTNQIGMAPGAKWIACAGCSSTECAGDSLLECAQFMVAPWDMTGANPNSDLRPHVINNSWGDCDTSYDGWYQGVVDAWHAAGIYPVFSNGNASNCEYSSPPGCNTVGNPGRYGNVTGVGSTGQYNGAYATHSNWGPTDNADTVNPNGFPYIKPNVAAPGVSIRSATNGSNSEYGSWNGTSMSAPHVAALIALMWQAAPCLQGNYADTETIIQDTATPIAYASSCGGEAGDNMPNNATGWGEIDALAAVNAALVVCGPKGTLSGNVTDAAKGPVAGVLVSIYGLEATTGADGSYSISDIPVGTHDVDFSSLYHLPQTVNGVVISEDATTTQDALLTPKTQVALSGTVIDGETHGWPIYAKLTFAPTLNPTETFSVFTDPLTGAFSTQVVELTDYDVTVESRIAGYDSVSQTVNIDTASTLDVELVSSDCTAPGYDPNVVYAEDFEADNGGWVTGGTTSFAWGTPTYGPNKAHSGTKVWATKLGGNYGIGENGYIISPDIDLSAYATGDDFTVSWWQYLKTEGCCDHAYVEISKDGGASWTTIYGGVGGDVNTSWGQRTRTVDSSYAVENVKLRFKLVSDGSVNYAGFYIDDVAITWNGVTGPSQCLHKPGGLVYGQVSDANTGDGVVGATLTNLITEPTTSIATADDPNVPEGVYFLFCESGMAGVRASMAGYGDKASFVAISDDAIVQQNFVLDAGVLAFADSTFSFQVYADQSGTDSTTLSNSGTLAADYVLSKSEISAKNKEPLVPWLTLLPTSGSLGIEANQAINLTVNATGIAFGSYSANVQAISSQAPYTPPEFTVTMDVGHAAEAVQSEHGAIEPADKTFVSHGGSITYTFTAAEGYHLQDVLVNGISMGEHASLTLNDVQEDKAVSALFVFTCTSDAQCTNEGNDCLGICDEGTCAADLAKPLGTACGDPTSSICTAPDTCNDAGVCLTNHLPSTTLCRQITGTCDLPEYCNGAGVCPADSVKDSSTVCRGQSAFCDLAEFCDGTSGVCPADNFKDSSVVCRSKYGECDVAETCTGSSALCPDDAFMDSATQCRAASGLCDAAEMCPGDGPDCPADAVKAVTEICRAAAGGCDVAEMCDGSSTACPTDVLMPGTHLCRTADGPCDVAESCTGDSVDCPADAFKPASELCRAAADVCDVAELCSGTGPACPADAFKPDTQLCREAAGVCDVDEFCSGSAAACPGDAFKPASEECRPVAGGCDVAESCTGASAACPADGFVAVTEICRAAADVCDLPEMCDGHSAACPDDVLMPDTHLCRTSDGPCDVAESCTGSDVACPADAFKPATELCREAAGPCDVDELCTGSDAACPTDVFQPADTLCREAAGECDLDEVCTGDSAQCPADVFITSDVVCREALSSCDLDETCTGDSAACPLDVVVEDGTVCNDELACTSGDVCDAGQCVGVAADCDDAIACTVDGCTAETGDCTHTPDDSVCTDDGNPCTIERCDASTGCVADAAADWSACEGDDENSSYACFDSSCEALAQNDLCADATTLIIGEALETGFGDHHAARAVPDDCLTGGVAGSDAFFVFSATAGTRYRVTGTPDGTTLDLVLVIWSGCTESDSCLLAADDTTAGSSEELVVDATDAGDVIVQVIAATSDTRAELDFSLLVEVVEDVVDGDTDADADGDEDGDAIDGDLDSDEPSDGDTPDGDTPDGDTPDGDTPDGDEPDGDMPDGDTPDGDTPDGDTPDGDTPDGDTDSDEVGGGGGGGCAHGGSPSLLLIGALMVALLYRRKRQATTY